MTPLRTPFLLPWLAVLGCLVLGSSLLAAEPPEFQLSESEGEIWMAQIERAIHRKNWTVTRKESEITIRRNEPAAMVIVPLNQNSFAERTTIPYGEQTLRYVLRFGPRMPLADYRRLAEVNEDSDREEGRLRRDVGVGYKFDRFFARTPEEKERVRQYQLEVAKLPRHKLPDLYTPDHSVILLRSGGVCLVPAEDQVADEFHDVGQRLYRLFGIYDPAVAGGWRIPGGYLEDQER